MEVGRVYIIMYVSVCLLCYLFAIFDVSLMKINKNEKSSKIPNLALYLPSDDDKRPKKKTV